VPRDAREGARVEPVEPDQVVAAVARRADDDAAVVAGFEPGHRLAQDLDGQAGDVGTDGDDAAEADRKSIGDCVPEAFAEACAPLRERVRAG
jgi:hypothetical protein